MSIFLDNAASHPVLPEMVLGHSSTALLQPGNPHALNLAGYQKMEIVEEAELALREVLGVSDAGTIVWTSSSTEAAAMFFYSMLASDFLITGDRQTLHPCVSRWVEATPQEAEATYPSDKVIEARSIGESISGLTMPVRDKPFGFLHVDATQVIGKADLRKMYDPFQADAINVGFHKCGGVPGIGALWVSDRALPHLANDPLIPGKQQGGLRGGTLPVALIASVGTLCRSIFAEMEIGKGPWLGEWMRVAEMRNDLLEVLQEAGFKTPLFGKTTTLPGHLYGYFDGVVGDHLVDVLAGRVDIASGSACTGKATIPCQLHALLGHKDVWPVRISLGTKNTNSHIRLAANYITQAVTKLRRAARA